MGKLKHVILHKSVINPVTKEAEKIDEEFVICDVCGHANPVKNHECEKCTNFLEED